MIYAVLLDLDDFLDNLEIEEKRRLTYSVTPNDAGFTIILSTIKRIEGIPVIWQYVEQFQPKGDLPGDELQQRLQEIFDEIGFKPMKGWYSGEAK